MCRERRSSKATIKHADITVEEMGGANAFETFDVLRGYYNDLQKEEIY